jgi:hypothetical protein
VIVLLLALALVAATPAYAAADKCPDASRAADALDAGIAADLERKGIVFDRPGTRMGSMRGAKQRVAVGCVYHAYAVFGVWESTRFVNCYFRATMHVDHRGWRAANLETY